MLKKKLKIILNITIFTLFSCTMPINNLNTRNISIKKDFNTNATISCLDNWTISISNVDDIVEVTDDYGLLGKVTYNHTGSFKIRGLYVTVKVTNDVGCNSGGSPYRWSYTISNGITSFSNNSPPNSRGECGTVHSATYYLGQFSQSCSNPINPGNLPPINPDTPMCSEGEKTVCPNQVSKLSSIANEDIGAFNISASRVYTNTGKISNLSDGISEFIMNLNEIDRLDKQKKSLSTREDIPQSKKDEVQSKLDEIINRNIYLKQEILPRLINKKEQIRQEVNSILSEQFSVPLVKPSTKEDYEAEIHELDQKNQQYLGTLNTVNLVMSYGVYADQMELLAFMIEDVSNEYSFSTQGFKVQGFNELIDALKDAAPALADKLRESQKIREAEWRRIDEAEQKRKEQIAQSPNTSQPNNRSDCDKCDTCQEKLNKLPNKKDCTCISESSDPVCKPTDPKTPLYKGFCDTKGSNAYSQFTIGTAYDFHHKGQDITFNFTLNDKRGSMSDADYYKLAREHQFFNEQVKVTSNLTGTEDLAFDKTTGDTSVINEQLSHDEGASMTMIFDSFLDQDLLNNYINEGIWGSKDKIDTIFKNYPTDSKHPRRIETDFHRNYKIFNVGIDASKIYQKLTQNGQLIPDKKVTLEFQIGSEKTKFEVKLKPYTKKDSGHYEWDIKCIQ